MAEQVWATDTPEEVLDRAAGFLASDPVRHNVILTLLHGRVTHPEAGRYWIVSVDGQAVGVVFQSPVHFIATVTPMPVGAVTAVVDAIVDQGVALPGVTGEAATAARFAGHWTERTRSAAAPVQGQRIYEVEVVLPAAPARGAFRQATSRDRDLIITFSQNFQAETGEAVSDAAEVVDRRLPAGHFWLWENEEEPVAIAGLSDPVVAVARVGPVYTPPDRRNCGYASALVASASSTVLSRGQRCILYTDLGNPTSNAIYRALGYRAVAEVVRYDFAAGR